MIGRAVTKRGLIFATMLALTSACAEGPDGADERMSSSTGPEHGDVAGRSAGRVIRVTPAAPMPARSIDLDVRRDAGRSTISQAQDDAGAEDDAGTDTQSPELDRAIVYDCNETVQCMGRPSGAAACIASVRDVFKTATPEQRQVFLETVARCRPQQSCSYVDCVSNKAP